MSHGPGQSDRVPHVRAVQAVIHAAQMVLRRSTSTLPYDRPVADLGAHYTSFPARNQEV
jgi:hypothetical protein